MNGEVLVQIRFSPIELMLCAPPETIFWAIQYLESPVVLDTYLPFF